MCSVWEIVHKSAVLQKPEDALEPGLLVIVSYLTLVLGKLRSSIRAGSTLNH